MQYFAWATDRPGAAETRKALMQTHWDFIARYDDCLIARGPVLAADDPMRPVGSIHIAELPDDDAAHTFVYDEPFAQAGVFGDILLTRFELELGRTQFEYEGQPDRPRFLVYCPAADGTPAEEPGDVRDAHRDYCAAFDEFFVCRGALFTLDGDWAGRLFLMEVPDRETVERFIDGDPCRSAGLYAKADIHRWTMGGAAALRAAGLVK